MKQTRMVDHEDHKPLQPEYQSTLGGEHELSAEKGLIDAQGSLEASGKCAVTIPVADDADVADDDCAANRLFISNFPFSWSEADLINFFEEFGPVESVEIVYNERGSKGFGFVTINDSSKCQKARAALNHTIVQGRRVEVRRAHRHRRARNTGRPGNAETPPPSNEATFAATLLMNNAITNNASAATLIGLQQQAIQSLMHQQVPMSPLLSLMLNPIFASGGMPTVMPSVAQFNATQQLLLPQQQKQVESSIPMVTVPSMAAHAASAQNNDASAQNVQNEELRLAGGADVMAQPRILVGNPQLAGTCYNPLIALPPLAMTHNATTLNSMYRPTVPLVWAGANSGNPTTHCGLMASNLAAPVHTIPNSSVPQGYSLVGQQQQQSPGNYVGLANAHENGVWAVGTPIIDCRKRTAELGFGPHNESKVRRSN